MRWSLSMGKILGIRVKVHWTFFLLIAWVVIVEYSRGSNIETILLTTVYVLSIFACVVFHEMGHALMARRFDIPTRKITLLPIGGVASLQRIPENPRQELLVALAGPIVNVVIAAVIYPFLGPLQNYIPQEGEAQALATITTDNFWFALFGINIILVLFNLIPAFPMDGGRMLRAGLAMRMNRLKATHIASSIGQVLAVVFFFAGLFLNPFLLLIGVFVFFGARGENYMVQQYEVLKDHYVREAMTTDLQTFNSNTELKKLTEHMLSSCDDTFLVVDEGETKGWVTRDQIIREFKEDHENRKLMDILKDQHTSISPDEKLSKVMEMMQNTKQTVFPVMKDGKLKGILNSAGLQRFMAIQSALNV
jgi:Zn-dependent protease/predicted transcriptional regulator